MVYPIPGKLKTMRGRDPIVDLADFFPCRCFFAVVRALIENHVLKNRQNPVEQKAGQIGSVRLDILLAIEQINSPLSAVLQCTSAT